MSVQENDFIKNGLHFQCQRCSFCCGHSPGFVYLSKRDLETLCSHFKLSPVEFAEKYGRWVTYYGGDIVLALFEKKNYDCVLWDNGCSAYEARPLQCSTYPFWTWMTETKESWDECAKDCPGMNKGPVHSAEEIIKCNKIYDDNVPIKKEEFDSLYR